MRRYLFVVPAVALLGAAPPSAGPDIQQTRVISPVPTTCKALGNIVGGTDAPPPIRRLDELPAGQTFMAVYRTDSNGCIDPMLASERQGFPSGRR
jgi:hypothetical protein